MSDFSGKTAQRAWNDPTPKALPWFPASILAGVIGGRIALLLLNTEIVVNAVGWLVDMLLDVLMGPPPEGAFMQEGGFNPLVLHLCGSIAGAVGGAVSGLVYYTSRRKPLRRTVKWGITWAIIGLLGTIFIVFVTDWIRRLPLIVSNYVFDPVFAFLVLSAIFGVLTAVGFYLIDPYGEEHG